MSSLEEQHHDAHSAVSLEKVQQIGDYVIHSFREAGVDDYCFALNVRGRRSYYAAGQVCDEEEVEQRLPRGIQLGCLIGPLVAAATLELSQGGRVDLHDPIGKFLPELARDKKGKLIQVQHLISHTPGYMAFGQMPPAHGFVNRNSALTEIRKARQIFKPGAVYNYDHAGTAMLGEILQGITERSVPEHVAEVIFSPLEVTLLTMQSHHSGMGSQAGGRSATYSGVRSLFGTSLSVPNVLLLVEFLMSDQNVNSRIASLSISTLAALREKVVEIPRTAGSSASKVLPTGYCMGLEAFRGSFVGYDTSTRSQASGFRFDPVRQIAMVLVTQGRYRVQRRVVLGGILDLIDDAGGNDVSEECERDVLTIAEIVGGYIGNYSFDANVRYIDGCLIFTICAQRKVQLEIRGHMDGAGRLVFKSRIPGLEPTFFREPGTGEICVMYGMFALKQVKRRSAVIKRFFGR